MSEKKDVKDLMGLFEVNLPEDSNNDVDLKRADINVENELEFQKEVAEARKLFDSGQLSYDEYVDDEGQVQIGIYTKSAQNTPLNKLMELCEADMPYVDEETKQDFEVYRKESGIEEVDYDPFEARRNKIKDLL